MKTKIALMVALLAMGTAHQASAAVHGLTVSQMINQTVASSSGFTQISGWTAAPTYGDGVTMHGSAGASDNLGISGYVYFELTSTDLATFLTGVVDGDNYSMRAWNDDNNDNWIAGIWFVEDGTVHIDKSLEPYQAGFTDYTLLMADVSEITQLGLYIENPSGDQGDTYHVSFTKIPEPGAIAIWAVLGGLGLVTSRRRKS